MPVRRFVVAHGKGRDHWKLQAGSPSFLQRGPALIGCSDNRHLVLHLHRDGLGGFVQVSLSQSSSSASEWSRSQREMY